MTEPKTLKELSIAEIEAALSRALSDLAGKEYKVSIDSMSMVKPSALAAALASEPLDGANITGSFAKVGLGVGDFV